MSLTIEIPSPLADKMIAAAERAGVSAEELATRLLGVATDRVLEEKPKARPSKAFIQSIQGKYADLPLGSDDFAREKRMEIEREDRHCL